MYRVIKFFTDLQDDNHPYYVGDEFPRKDKEVDEERITELASNKNRQGCPLIQLVEEKEAVPKKPKKAATKKAAEK